MFQQCTHDTCLHQRYAPLHFLCVWSPWTSPCKWNLRSWAGVGRSCELASCMLHRNRKGVGGGGGGQKRRKKTREKVEGEGIRILSYLVVLLRFPTICSQLLIVWWWFILSRELHLILFSTLAFDRNCTSLAYHHKCTNSQALRFLHSWAGVRM